jgi:hypothetical protein
MPESQNFGFVPDGYERARSAIEPQIRREVELEFEEQLQAATRGESRRIRSIMEELIEERINRLAPPDALY